VKAATLLAVFAIAAAPAVAGPPWISIELPANPFDRATRGAYLVVHTYHHELQAPYVVSGTAEGLVNGQRRSMRLEAQSTGRTGSFAIRRTWPQEGVWVLRIEVADIEAGVAVGVGTDGEVAFVRVPTGREGAPRQLARVEVETLLRALADNRQIPQLARAGGGGHGQGTAKVVQLAGMSALGGAALVGLVAAIRRRVKNKE